MRQDNPPRMLGHWTRPIKGRAVTGSSVPPESQAAPKQHASSSATARPLSVWARIKEHKVAQWTLAYAAAAYTVLHGTEMVSNAFEWPHLLVRIVTLLVISRVAAGRDNCVVSRPSCTTTGKRCGIDNHHRIAGRYGRRVGVSRAPDPRAFRCESWRDREDDGRDSAARDCKARERSIAVLPFTDMSEGRNQEYFADGMAEEIINRLAQVPELHVPARTSSFFFKGKSTKSRTSPASSGVAHVLEGSVRKSGNQLRLTAQLIRADSGYHVWSQTYDVTFRTCSRCRMRSRRQSCRHCVCVC